MNERLTIALVGCGRMGANMARRLHDTGWRVTALNDANVSVAQALANELGSQSVTSLPAVTAAADVIITVVSNDAAMDGIFATDGPSLLENAKGKTFVNCATLSPAMQREAAKRAAERGAETLEACMASSIPQARSGSLYLMCAGRRETFDRLQPLLADLATTSRYIGEAGRAAELKALVNMVMNSNTAALAEGLGLANALGLDLDIVRDVFGSTGAASRVLETDGADMQNREHDTYFSAEHAAKDSGIALELAKQNALDLPVARAAYEQYRRLCREGLGNLDKSAVAELTFRGRHA